MTKKSLQHVRYLKKSSRNGAKVKYSDAKPVVCIHTYWLCRLRIMTIAESSLLQGSLLRDSVKGTGLHVWRDTKINLWIECIINTNCRISLLGGARLTRIHAFSSYWCLSKICLSAMLISIISEPKKIWIQFCVIISITVASMITILMVSIMLFLILITGIFGAITIILLRFSSSSS